MKPFEELDRYIYPLTPDSVVLDCGGYEGWWAAGIQERYGCTIHVLEPVERFYTNTVTRLLGLPKVSVYHFGIAGTGGVEKFSIKGDMTGKFADNPESEWVNLMSVEEVFKRLKLDRVAVFKINIEGSEFDVVEKLIETGLIDRVDNLQVQWHPVVPDYQARFDALQAALAKTHHLTFDAQWVWQNWKRNEQ